MDISGRVEFHWIGQSLKKENDQAKAAREEALRKLKAARDQALRLGVDVNVE